VAVVIASDARPLDLLEALDDGGQAVTWRGRRAFGLLARQVEGGTAVAVRDGQGRLCLVVGIYAGELGEAEAWFAAGVGLRDALLPSLRIARQVLEFVGREAAPVAIGAYTASVAGARLAAWFGFTAQDVGDDAPGAIRTWSRSFP
jgi:hypothetical protein